MEIKFISLVENDNSKNDIYPFVNRRVEFAGGAINEIFATSGKPNLNPYANCITYFQYTDLNDVKGEEIYFDFHAVKLTVWFGFEEPCVSLFTRDVIDGRDSEKYEYTGVIKRDRFGNPYLYSPHKEFYFANLLDADGFEFEIIGNVKDNPELFS